MQDQHPDADGLYCVNPACKAALPSGAVFCPRCAMPQSPQAVQATSVYLARSTPHPTVDLWSLFVSVVGLGGAFLFLRYAHPIFGLIWLLIMAPIWSILFVLSLREKSLQWHWCSLPLGIIMVGLASVLVAGAAITCMSANYLSYWKDFWNPTQP